MANTRREFLKGFSITALGLFVPKLICPEPKKVIFDMGRRSHLVSGLDPELTLEEVADMFGVVTIRLHPNKPSKGMELAVVGLKDTKVDRGQVDRWLEHRRKFHISNGSKQLETFRVDYSGEWYA